MNTDGIDDLNIRVYDYATELVEGGENPLAVAAIFTLIALQIYKTSMNDDDYNAMLDTISDSRDRVKKFGDTSVHRLQ